MLRKTPLANVTKAKDLRSFVQWRCDQYDTCDWQGLIVDHEANVVTARSVHRNHDISGNTKDEAKLRKALDLLAHMQCSKAHKYLQSNGLGNHTNDAIVQQMMWKYPACTQPITPLTVEELRSQRKGINSEVFQDKLKGLKHDVAPGIGGLHNRHLLLLMINLDR